MKKPKTNSERIIEALRSGKELASAGIVETVSALAGQKARIQDIASLLSRLTNPENTDFAFFIKKEKRGRRFVYRLVTEALVLTPVQLYGLYRKTGKKRYSLAQAIKDHPELKKYVPAERLEQIESGVSAKNVKKKGKSPKKSAAPKTTGTLDNIVSQIVNEIINRGGLKVDINVNFNIK
ncbi:MAG: hypothetical protein GXP53_12155 [Deltaproteobacteria bacterium]|nr:hypothetical protein [Deltaproteobacteria bacterium]